ncbi:hypothetical protein [Shewanella sp. SR44-3]|uniref:hypothetical protein n=1 Tax=unclassified Shewanella TaxID=196818 RepID=UPI0015FC335E|nr:hypothetical protein [Shewanella sp. SR44-3]MBB1269191.1 hypothetical protein [Shewanella sp. SR44-3]
MNKLLSHLLTVVTLSALTINVANAALPIANAEGVVEIHLEQHGGHFSARDTLVSLKAGKYQFVITNKAEKLAGFQLQNFTTHEALDMFPLEPGETRRSEIVEVTEQGVRFRCPINPTPW